MHEQYASAPDTESPQLRTDFRPARLSVQIASPRLQSCGEGCELIGADAPTFMEAHLLVRLAVRHGPVLDARRVLRPAIVIFERDGGDHERLLRRLPAANERIGE